MHDNLTSPPVLITVLDDDVASVLAESVIVVSELGDAKSFTYSLELGSQPTANVTLEPDVDSSDVLLLNGSFTFTPSDWNVSQIAHGVVYDDAIDEGDVETRPISHFVTSADSFYDNLTVPPVNLDIMDNDVSPLPIGFHIVGVAIGPTSGGTQLTLVPEFSEPNATYKAFLFGEFAAQFEIDARVFDVARQRRIMGTDCAWVRAVENGTQAHASCFTPAVPYAGNAFSYELQVRWSNRGFTPWMIALESYEYHLPVRVSRGFPNSSPVCGGSSVIVHASNFMTIAGVTPACVFRAPAEEGRTAIDVYVPARVVTIGSLACTAPALGSGVGVGQLRVTVNGQQPSMFFAPFTYYHNNCTVVDLSVTAGPTSGSTTIAIYGQGFVDTVILCSFTASEQLVSALGNVSANVSVQGTFVSAGQVLCTTPPVPTEAVGGFALTLSFNGGQDQCTGLAAHFAYYEIPRIEKMDPPMAIVEHRDSNASEPTPLHVFGTGLNQTGTLLSQFGEDNATGCTIVNDTSAVCFAPPSHSAGRVRLTLSLNGRNWMNASDPDADDSSAEVYLTYVPVVTSHYPTIGPGSGGTNVSIRGYGFVPTGPRGSPSCIFGQQQVPAQVVSDTHMFCTSPDLFPTSSRVGLHSIYIGSSVGEEFFNVAPTEFWFHDEPVIKRLSSQSAPITGRVLLTLFLSQVELPPGTPAFVRILPALSAAHSGRVFPATWEGDNVVVDLPDFTLPSYREFSRDLPGDIILDVTFNAVDWRLQSAPVQNRLNVFDATLDPVVREVRPATGPYSGGTELSLHGSNFANLPSLRCVFHIEAPTRDDNTTAPESAIGIESFATWISATEARCMTPNIAMAATYGAAWTAEPFVRANVTATNLGMDINSSSHVWFCFTSTEPAASLATGSGLGLNEVDLVVAGETASFTIRAMRRPEGGDSTVASRQTGGDMFYVTLAPPIGNSMGQPLNARTFDMDEIFTTVDVTREKLAVALAENAVVLQAKADTAEVQANLVYAEYDEALLVLGSFNAVSPQQQAREWQRVKQIEHYADELAHNASGFQLVAKEALARADEAAAVVNSLMLPDADSVVEAVTLATYTYNDYYCTMYQPPTRRITECCADAPMSCARLPDLAGTHLGLYRVTIAGVHRLDVTLANVPVSGSPWYVMVSPAVLSPSRTVLSGLTDGTTTGDTLDLQLAPRDRFGNDRVEPLDGAFHPGMGADIGVTFSLQTKTNARQINWRLEDTAGTVWAEQPTDTYGDDTGYTQDLILPSRAYRFYAMATSGHGWYNAKLLIIQKSTGLPLIGPIILGDFGPRKLFSFSIGVRASLGLYLCTTLLNPAPDRCHQPGLQQDSRSSVAIHMPDAQGRIPVQMLSLVSGTFMLRASVNGDPIDSDMERIVFDAGPTQPNVSIFFRLDEEFIAGNPGELVMQAYDQFANYRGIGGDSWDANPTLAHDRATDTVQIRDNRDSTFGLSFTVTVSGEWRPQISLEGRLMGSGALSFQVLPAEIDVGACILVGESAHHVIAGDDTKLTVQGRDRFGNNRTTNDCTMGITMHRGATPSQRSCTDWGSRGYHRIAGLCGTEELCSQLSCPMIEAFFYWCNSSLVLDGVPTLMATICPATCGNCETVVRVLATEYEDDGRYIAFFNETLAHDPLQLTVAIGPVDLVLKPEPIVVLPAVTDVASSLAWGAGLSDSAAGNPIRVTLKLRDRFRNDRAIGGELSSLSFDYARFGEIPTIWEQRPDLVPETFNIRDNNDGTYTITYLFNPVANYTLQIHHDSVEFSVSPVTIRKTARPAPALSSVAFDSSLSRIRATFDYPTNMIGVDDGSCTALLDSALLARLGQGASCGWYSATTLVVSLHSRSEIVPGTVRFEVPFGSPLVSHMENSEAANSSALIEAPPSLVVPRIILRGPTRVGACDSFALNAALSYGGGSRGLVFQWQPLQHMFQFVPGRNQMLASVVSSQTSSTLRLDPDALFAGRDYTFRLTVRNVVGISATAEWVVHKAADTVLPLEVANPRVETTADKPSLLMAVARQPLQCDESTLRSGKSRVMYRWSLADGPNITAAAFDISSYHSSRVLVPAGALQTFGVYSFDVLAYLDGMPAINNTARVVVSVVAADLDVGITGGDRALCGGSIAASLDAVKADRSTLPGNWTYSWTCVAISPTGERVVCPVSIAAANSSRLELDNLLHATYTISAVVTHNFIDGSGSAFERSAVSTTVLELRTEACSHFEVTRMHSHAPLHSERLALHGRVHSDTQNSVRWYTDRLDVLDLRSSASTVTGTSGLNLIVAAGAMQPGKRYTFFLLPDTGHNRSSYAEAVIDTADAPCCGTFTVTPQEGVALTSSFALQTTAAQHADWSGGVDRMPLSYQFQYHKCGNTYALSEPQLDQSLQTFLPVGSLDGSFALNLSVTVSDIYGAATTSEALVTATPLDPSSSSDAMNQTLTVVEDSILLGSSQSVGLIMTLCDVLNYVSSTATNSSRRLLAVATDGSAERTAIRERLAYAVVDVSAQTDGSIASMLGIASMLTAVPCELSSVVVDLLTPWLAYVISNADTASVEAAIQGATAVDNLYQTRNCRSASLELADLNSILLDCNSSNSSSSCECNDRGECVDGVCQCAKHTCTIARCTLTSEFRAPGCYQPNPLCHATDATASCNTLSCEVGLCPPGDTTCFEGRCVPGTSGLDCFLGSCPEVSFRWALPDCMQTEDVKYRTNVLEERHKICSATALQSSLQSVAELISAQRVANEAELKLPLQSFQLRVATPPGELSGYVIQPPEPLSAANRSLAASVTLPSQCEAAVNGPDNSGDASIAGIGWSMNPFPFGLADDTHNSSYTVSRVASLALSPCSVGDLGSDPFVIVLPRVHIVPILPPIIPSACPLCSQHGQCDNGTCYCDKGFAGTNCSSHVVVNDAPTMLSIEECRSWNLAVNSWEDTGCLMALTNSTHIVCECGFQPQLIAAFKTDWVPVVVELNSFEGERLSAFAADAMSLSVFFVVCSVTLIYLVLARSTYRVSRARQHQKIMQRGLKTHIAENNGGKISEPTYGLKSGSSLAMMVARPSLAMVVPVGQGQSSASASKYLPDGEGELETVVRSSVGVRGQIGRVASLLNPQWLCNELAELGLGRTHIWLAVWRERPHDPISRLQRLTVILVIMLSNIALSVALFGVSRCKPRHRPDCSQSVNGCRCSPEPEDISWGRIVATSLFVSVLMLPCDRILLGMWEIVEWRPFKGAIRGPGGRPWKTHDFATDHGSIILVQVLARAFIARKRVRLARKLRHSQQRQHHADIVALAGVTLPPPPSRRAALKDEMKGKTKAPTSKVWVRRRPYNSAAIDPKQIAFAVLVGIEGRTPEEVVRGAVTVQRWFRRALIRRHNRWLERVHASHRRLDVDGGQPVTALPTLTAASTDHVFSGPLKRSRRQGVASMLAGQTVRKTLPAWFGRLVFACSFVWSVGCGVYSVLAAAFYSGELTRAWAACLALSIIIQVFVFDVVKSLVPTDVLTRRCRKSEEEWNGKTRSKSRKTKPPAEF